MIRPVTLASFAVALALGFALFKVKYEVQSIEDKMVHVERQMALDEEAIHVYKASWSMETRPQALAMLASRHLDLKPMTSAEIGSFDALPLNEEVGKPGADRTVSPAEIAEANLPDTSPSTPAPAKAPAQTATVHLATLHTAAARGSGVQVASLPASFDSGSGDTSVDAVLQAMQSGTR